MAPHAGQLNSVSRRYKNTLSGLLGNRVYVGEVFYRGEVYRGEHDGIVGRALWTKAQRLQGWAEVAQLGHITRARASQFARLACLPPDIVEEILSLPATTSGRSPITERDLRPVAAEPLWARQRRDWQKLLGSGALP